MSDVKIKMDNYKEKFLHEEQKKSEMEAFFKKNICNLQHQLQTMQMEKVRC